MAIWSRPIFFSLIISSAEMTRDPEIFWATRDFESTRFFRNNNLFWLKHRLIYPVRDFLKISPHSGGEGASTMVKQRDLVHKEAPSNLAPLQEVVQKIVSWIGTPFVRSNEICQQIYIFTTVCRCRGGSQGHNKLRRAWRMVGSSAKHSSTRRVVV